MSGEEPHEDAPRPDQSTEDVPGQSHASALDLYLATGTPRAHPRSIGPWTLLEVLGEGGMGIVYLAEQSAPVRRRVALKLIKLGMDTKEVLARFDRERQALALMDHPNIARVLDAGAAEDGRPYFVMELVKGLPLTEYCDRNKLPLRERLVLFEQVCHAVQHAHHKGIIHRDIKPSNILVSSSAEAPVAKIIDFGVARAVQRTALDRSVYTEMGQMIGTPSYMSPEQADMTSEDIDTRSDIYSLGVVLYELLVGVVPFEGADLRRAGFDEMRRIIREVEPPAPSTKLSQLRGASAAVAERRKSTINYLAREIRGDLDWITLRAIEKDRTRRYATASELAADLRRYLEMQPILARRPGALYRLQKLVRRRRGAFLGFGAAAVVMVCTAIVMKVMEERNLREASDARSRSLRAQGDAAWAEHLERSAEMSRTRERLNAAVAALPTWAPVWERSQELSALDDLETVRRKAEDARIRAELSFTGAIETAARGHEEEAAARRALGDLFLKLYQRSLPGERGIVARDYFRARAEAVSSRVSAGSPEGRGRVSISSEPAGATVYCFRYIRVEGRLLPVPFDAQAGATDPARGLLPAAALRVDRVQDEASPIVAGDRIAEVAGKPIGSIGDLARSLASVAKDDRVSITLERRGERISSAWVPFPASRYAPAGPLKAPYLPGRLIDSVEQLGFTLEAYPLEFPERSLLGTTGQGRPIEQELPAGSYILVLRHEGYADARLPVAVPETAGSEIVKLLPSSDVPAGFVPIHAGPVACGGDPDAFQAFDAAVERLPTFCMARLELTTAEYLEFVNDPEVRPRTDDEGLAIPAVDAVKEDLQRAGAADSRVQLIPRYVNRPKDRIQYTMWNRVDGLWQLEGSWKAARPMMGIPQHAALEYAAWRTRRDGGRWRYRLPTDLEWEKAARGVDRRLYVWGDQLIWSFCWSPLGIVGDGQARPPAAGGISPFDESVFGVRDMAGSVTEHTSSRPVAGRRLTTVRGGGWLSIDRQDFHAASRSTLDPIHSRNSSGIRLVAEKTGE